MIKVDNAFIYIPEDNESFGSLAPNFERKGQGGQMPITIAIKFGRSTGHWYDCDEWVVMLDEDEHGDLIDALKMCDSCD